MKARTFVAVLVSALCVITAQWGVVAGAAPVGEAQAGARDPVIVIEGTGSSQPLLPILDYNLLVDRLERDGYRAYLFRLPGFGLGDIRETSAEFRTFVDQVIQQTGASKVDLIGHSQGGLVGRYYIKSLGGASRVDSMIGLAAPHYGTGVANLVYLYGILDCLGFAFCQQSVTGSDFLRNLNGDDDTFGNVAYTNFVSALDEIVVPYTNAFQRSSGATNVTIQSRCPLRVVEHLLLAIDGTTYSGIQDALAKRPISLDCLAL